MQPTPPDSQASEHVPSSTTTRVQEGLIRPSDHLLLYPPVSVDIDPEIARRSHFPTCASNYIPLPPPPKYSSISPQKRSRDYSDDSDDEDGSSRKGNEEDIPFPSIFIPPAQSFSEANFSNVFEAFSDNIKVAQETIKDKFINLDLNVEDTV